MSKVRVYELAKEYGLKGPDLAKMLKELGFDAVKSHMAVLDDATELQVRAIIETQGLSQQAAPHAAEPEAPPSEALGPKKKQLPAAGGHGGQGHGAQGHGAQGHGAQGHGAPGHGASSHGASSHGAGSHGGASHGGEATASEPARKQLPDPLERKRLPEPARKELPSQKPLPPKRRVPDAEDAVVAEPGVAEAREATPVRDVQAPRETQPVPEPVAAPEPVARGPLEVPPTESPAREERRGETSRPSEAAASEESPARGSTSRQEPVETAVEAVAPEPAPGEPGENALVASADAGAKTISPTDTTSSSKQPPPAARQSPSEAVPGRPVPRQADLATSAEGSLIGPAGQAVKRLLVPEAKAKVLGRIELPPEAIRDAQRRSAPAQARNPGSVDRNLRQAALRSTQSRSAAPRARPTQGGGTGNVRRGPTQTTGPGGRPRPGMRGGRRGGGGLASSVDPSKVVEVQPPITVKALSEALGVKVNDLIATLTFKLGVIGKNINSFLTNDEVELIGLEVNRNIRIVERQEAEAELLSDLQAAHADVDTEPRAPVVTFMGHVDHGKTTLLDALRKSDVAHGEAGGITQHIGAYKVTWHDGAEFVVLDTPGHEAFTSMRARGAKLTDIVVLVVAADDGVMPQTEEAIAHATDAKTKIIVAINKCDKPGARPMQVKQQLAVKGLQPEEWGGQVAMIEVSGQTGLGLDALVERIMLEAEIMQLTAKADAPAEAVVVESRQSPEQGVVVNVLVTNGTLHVKDTVLCGESLARVRGLVDDHGRQVKEAGPATPLSLLGLDALPMPGDRLYVITDVKKAKEVAEDRQRTARTISLAERSQMTAENLRARLEQRTVEEIKIILKADVMGSLEPIRQSLAKLNTEEVKVNVIHAALGGITETDVSLAQASGAVVIGFNSVADQSARQAAERSGVTIRFYDVIYNLIDDVKLAMEGKLKPEEVEEVIGHAEIRAIFRSSKFGNIAGCFVIDGVARRSASVRLSRDGRVIYTGQLGSLRREKDDVREVKGGFECGMVLKDYNDIKEGDQLEFYAVKLVKRTLD